MKFCPRCSTEKPLIEFHKNRAKSDGVQPYCKRCWLAYTYAFQKTPKGKAIQKRHYTSDQGRANQGKREQKYNRTDKGITANKAKCKRRYHADLEYSRLKNNARSAGVTVGVLRQVQECDQVCRLCGSDKNLQFDHIYPISLGGKGTLDNLQLLCQPCNVFKSNHLFLPGGGMILTREF